MSSVRRRRPNELFQGELQSSIKRNIMKLCVWQHGSRLYRRTDCRLHPITVSWRTRVCGAVRKSVAWSILRVGRASLWTRVLQGWQSSIAVRRTFHKISFISFKFQIFQVLFIFRDFLVHSSFLISWFTTFIKKQNKNEHSIFLLHHHGMGKIRWKTRWFHAKFQDKSK